MIKIIFLIYRSTLNATTEIMTSFSSTFSTSNLMTNHTNISDEGPTISTSNLTTNYTNTSDAGVQRKPPSAEDLAFYALLGRVARGVTLFTLIWCPTLIILGSLFNCLSFAVLTRPNMRKISANIYLATLAVSDFFLVWVVR